MDPFNDLPITLIATYTFVLTLTVGALLLTFVYFSGITNLPEQQQQWRPLATRIREARIRQYVARFYLAELRRLNARRSVEEELTRQIHDQYVRIAWLQAELSKRSQTREIPEEQSTPMRTQLSERSMCEGQERTTWHLVQETSDRATQTARAGIPERGTTVSGCASERVIECSAPEPPREEEVPRQGATVLIEDTAGRLSPAWGHWSMEDTPSIYEVGSEDDVDSLYAPPSPSPTRFLRLTPSRQHLIGVHVPANISSELAPQASAPPTPPRDTIFEPTPREWGEEAWKCTTHGVCNCRTDGCKTEASMRGGAGTSSKNAASKRV